MGRVRAESKRPIRRCVKGFDGRPGWSPRVCLDFGLRECLDLIPCLRRSCCAELTIAIGQARRVSRRLRDTSRPVSQPGCPRRAGGPGRSRRRVLHRRVTRADLPVVGCPYS
ncbi:hypothetical protein SLNWT_1707 [Streptomyces albus]|uniref:Uncharacterized protein n=1 Tax=Streptomyces albus (strain ATCC 21838 / DSM 41398 / FERM P-419 / JCM 4703 / NBRC 107858) TaxID=1081613 RepID=A0A0B5EIK7_STRA4|nr:hypothetical protein SLNWT_1707 [Streptomyces albus]AOU76400.1 hypothetical protein SLNHY_1709 [Streptomyces albus]AYN32185.1 hypothetical protein DUI70_1683 [Streptomyces albus]